MTTLTIEIDKDKDLLVLKELINQLGLKYSVDKNSILSNNDDLRRLIDNRYTEYLDGSVELVTAEESQLKIQVLLAGKTQ